MAVENVFDGLETSTTEGCPFFSKISLHIYQSAGRLFAVRAEFAPLL